MSIGEAFEEVARGNAEALKVLYEQFRYIVYSLAFSILKEKQAAEDVLQDTFVRVYEHAGACRPGTNPKAWIVSIARNLAYDAYRRGKKTASHDNTDCFGTPESSIVQRMELTEALLRLGEIERQIVVMHLLAGLKHREISEELGIPAGTVRWKYRQSLSRLAEWIGGDDHGTGTASFPAQR